MSLFVDTITHIPIKLHQFLISLSVIVHTHTNMDTHRHSWTGLKTIVCFTALLAGTATSSFIIIIIC